MRILNALIGLGLLMMAVVAIVEVAAPSPGASQAAPVSERLGADTDRLDMLAVDQRMLQRMSSSASPDMTTMIQTYPMWVDPEMIRLQEQYQTQIERMLGKRPGQP
jgi:hypothetical protein